MRQAWCLLPGVVPFYTSPASKTFKRRKRLNAGFAVKTGVLVHPVRLACTGNPSGPTLYHLLEVIGKEKTLARIEMALSNGFAT